VRIGLAGLARGPGRRDGPLPAYEGKMLHLGHVHGRIAELAAHVHAARRLVLAAMRRKSAGADATSVCRLAKAYTSELSVRVAVEAVRLHGSAGVRPGWPAERILRDSLPNFYGGQSSDYVEYIAAHAFSIGRGRRGGESITLRVWR